MFSCMIEPPEQPAPIVYRIGPYISAIRSLTIIIVSAASVSFAFVPWSVSDEVATMKPRRRAVLFHPSDVLAGRLEAADAAGGAEDPVELAVPALLSGPGRVRLRRVVERHELVDAAVHRPALDTDDALDRVAAVVGEVRDVRGHGRAGEVVRLEAPARAGVRERARRCVARRRLVPVRVPRRRVAVRIRGTGRVRSTRELTVAVRLVPGIVTTAGVATGWAQTHGCSCSPEKTGPLAGWFVIVRRADERPPGLRDFGLVGTVLATTSLSPSASPSTRPLNVPSARSANALVTSRP